MRGEISYDLVMEENMKFVEATFRLPDGDWQVLIVKRRDVPEAHILSETFESGVHGVVVHVPRWSRLNKELVERLLGEWLGVDEWDEVRGPDSMNLR